MAEHRIYNDKFDINTQNTMDFYNARAKRANEMECPYTAVLLGDATPEYAEEWYIHDKNNLLPLLKVDGESIVLDIGCGMGRWAEYIIPDSKYYYGVDFSSEMIKLAKERCVFQGKDYEFAAASFQETVLNAAPEHIHKFNRFVISGVCIYINDEDLYASFKKVGDLLDEHCTILIKEPIAIERRLTLNEFESEALKSTYDAIYRTREEYYEILRPLMDNGFSIKHEAKLDTMEHEKKFSETGRWFIVLER